MAEETPNRIKLGALVLAIGAAAVLPFVCDDRPKEPASSNAPPASPNAPPASPNAANANPAATGTPAAAATPGANASEFTWTKPGTWTDGKSASAMRKATYVIARAEGDTDDAELSVIVAGGSAQANIERWEGQFGGAKAKTGQRNPHNVAVTLVEIEGDSAGGGPMMGGSSEKKTGWMLLGAIASINAGQHYFFKMTGPKKTPRAKAMTAVSMVRGSSPSTGSQSIMPYLPCGGQLRAQAVPGRRGSRAELT